MDAPKRAIMLAMWRVMMIAMMVPSAAPMILLLFAPLEGRREAIVTERHTAIDYAHALKHVADEMFPRAEKIVLVQDNLNTHKR